ncbi:MAG: hypothetical protein IKK06_01745 [Clostridia bacterium]|nr:hypothetical protein [Clostridia bacterium]
MITVSCAGEKMLFCFFLFQVRRGRRLTAAGGIGAPEPKVTVFAYERIFLLPPLDKAVYL